MVNWKSYGKVGDTSKYHVGTIKLADGTITTQDSAGASTLTAGTLNFNMSSVSADAADLTGHLMDVDFFNVAQYATSTFTFESFDGTNATGTLNIIGKTASITAPAVVTISPESVTVDVSMFLLDALAIEMPYFVAEKSLKPEKHTVSSPWVWALATPYA